MVTTGPKKKGWFRRFKRRLLDGVFNSIGPALIGGTMSLLSRTLKLEYDGREYYEGAFSSGRPVLLVFFHEDLFSIFLFHLRLRPCTVSVMLSQSRDGGKLAPIISRYGLVPIRSSSSRGAVRGMLETLRWLKARREGPSVTAIALDGPRGPRRQVKAGSAMLARKAEALILPVAFSHSRKFVFSSWDKMLLPKPFAHSKAWAHEAIDTKLWSDDDEANARLLTETLKTLKKRAGVP